MREFKFRVWDCGEMYYQARCGGMFDGIPTAPTVWIDTHNDGWVNTTGQPHTVIMQYTGLRDRNGVEVYEGDILSNGEHINWQVGFHDGSFKVVHTNLMMTDKWILNQGKAEQREIVGNVWENPELRDNW